MKIFALSDLHLSFDGRKPMSVFGDHWRDHPARVEAAWRSTVGEEDVVCLPGDFCWAMRLADMAPELAWLGSLPGRKILLRGNHDYWWASAAKVRAALPPQTFALHNDALSLGAASFAGTRGWVDPSLDFSSLRAEALGEGGAPETLLGIEGAEQDRKIYERELARLEASLRLLDPKAALRIALLHFPPTSPRLEATPVTELLERYGVRHAIFGHLHRSGPTHFRNPYGERGAVTYHLTSVDYVDFAPVLIAEVP